MSLPHDQKLKPGQSEFVKWFGPLLQALRDLGGSASPREAIERIAEIEKVPESVREVVLKSGQERFYNQVLWARQYLVWEGLIESGVRGIWSLTHLGKNVVLSPEEARQIFLKQVQRHAKLRKPASVSEVRAVEEAGVAADTPQADEDASLQGFLRVVKTLSPIGFERLCMRRLRESGFERVQVTGRSKNDGGIDGVGVLQLNDLMGFNAVFQCKKWEQSVPPKEIRDLRGAMDGRAEKGIFLTTSTFSSNARAEAERAGAVPVELVDGEKFYEMFKRHELGLKPRTVFDIDLSFFEQFE